MPNDLSPLFRFADDGEAFYQEVAKRLNAANRPATFDTLCKKAGICFSTAWRWKTKGSKPDAGTILRIERSLKEIESL